MFRYDMARIYLDENFDVRDQFLELEWNLKRKDQPIEVIGFSPDLDEIHNKVNACYHLKCSEILSLF